MSVLSGEAIPPYFQTKVKTWIAASAGVILLLMADILIRVYDALPITFSLPKIFSLPSIPVFLSLITILPVTIFSYIKWMNGCASPIYAKKASPALIGALFGALFFALFVTLLATKSDELQRSYLIRMASFSKYLSNAEIWDLLAFCLSVNILRPILEELVFRGLIFQSVAEKYGLFLGGGLSSASFAVIHSGLEFSAVLAFAFGVVSCGLVYYSRGIAASLYFHVIYNSLITAFGFLCGM